jgi:hypothetical protein
MINQQSVETLASQCKSLNEYPQELVKSLTLEVLLPSGLALPQLNYTPRGIIGTIRVGKKATIVKTTLKEGADWSETISCLDPAVASFLSSLFLRDTGLTVATIFGDDYWNAFRSAIVKDEGTVSHEKVLKMVWACVAGDMLYWRMTAQIYMDAVENETNDLKMMVLAKKAQIAFGHSKMVEDILKKSVPCDITITNI